MPARSQSAKRHVALLRGINLAGRNRIAMPALVAMFSDAGASDVGAYIQSGNILFTASAALAARLPALVSARIADDLGFKVPLVTRSADEIADIVASNPFVAEGADPATLHVSFLADLPRGELDPERSPDDRFALHGRHLYLHMPNGVARSKLTTDYIDRRLQTMGTARNWRTVTQLLALTRTPR